VHYLSLNRFNISVVAMKIKLPPILYKRGAAWLAFLGPFFFLSYGWLNYITSGRSDIGVVVESWEHYIPFVPWLMLPYMSIDAFYAASLFLFRKRSALDRHALRLLLATVISLLGFLLYPLQFSFAVPKADGFNGALQAILLGFDKPYNQAPSLHISLLIVLWVVYAKKLTGWARLALHAWFLAIGASVLFVYQHHFIDVWTGALAGVVCLYLIPDAPFAWRWQRPTARMQSLGLRYGLGAVLLLVFGLNLGKISGFLTLACIWVASALLLVAAAYYGLGRQVFQRHRGHMRWPARFMLAPYLFGSWLSYRFYSQNRPLANQVHPQVWLGAFPRISQKQTYARFMGVLDLSNEFANASMQAPLTKHIPVMDLTPPCPQTLVKAANWLNYALQQGDVLVHCALGLSRSASVVVCWLVWRCHALDTQAAVLQVNKQRPGLVLSAEHLVNIDAALQQLRGRKS
jgi:hypothetical protein